MHGVGLARRHRDAGEDSDLDGDRDGDQHEQGEADRLLGDGLPERHFSGLVFVQLGPGRRLGSATPAALTPVLICVRGTTETSS